VSERICVLGAGKAGEALVAGLLSSGYASPGDIVATVRHEEHAAELAERYGIETTLDNAAAVGGARIVVIAVKPQDIETLLREIGAALDPAQTVLSIAAAIPTAFIACPSCAQCRIPR
jgi:pyrroline-5-carboxylate reductase